MWDWQATPTRWTTDPPPVPSQQAVVRPPPAAAARAPRSLPCGRYTLPVGGRALVMGILNVTPDSFSDGGRYLSPTAARDRALAMVEEGADLIDLGGESTRPGADPVPLAEELRRVLPVIQALAPTLPVPLSIDTRKAAVAREAVAAGASMVNDVSALRGDPAMAGVIAGAGVPVILMHMQGTPQMMQDHPQYTDVVAEVVRWLQAAAVDAQARGIAAERICLDPGMGFGKRLAHNLRLLRHLDRLVETGYPVVVGPSRKSFLGEILQVGPDERLMGTAAAVALAVAQGAAIVRVHDVKAMAHVVRTAGAICRAA